MLLEDPSQQHFGPVDLATVHGGAEWSGGILEPANPGAEEGVFA
jgi:hypothetical protein